jgi:hypothetical protein
MPQGIGPEFKPQDSPPPQKKGSMEPYPTHCCDSYCAHLHVKVLAVKSWIY